MKRMRGYSNLGGRGAAMDEAAREARLRALAERLRPRGRTRLRLGEDCARALRTMLREISAMDAAGDDALNRLRSDAGRVEACLRQAKAESGARTVASEDGPRVLLLARELTGGGERLLTREQLMRELALFDSARSLEMGELQLVPAALRVALCEALRGVASDVLRVAKARAAADDWVRAGGKGRMGGNCDEAFFERALRLSLELEQPELHARIERAIERCGQRREWLVERAQRIEADNCLRLDNLMQLKHLLDGLNWRKCFEALSATEQELRDDPAGLYPRMDAASRAQVRGAVEELARHAKTEETIVARHALRLARAAKQDQNSPRNRARIPKAEASEEDARLPKEEASAERLRISKAEPGAEDSRLPKTEASGEALRAAMEEHGSNRQRAEAEEPSAEDSRLPKTDASGDGSRLSKDMRETDGARLLKEEASAEQLRMSKAETGAEDSRLSTMEASGEAVRAAMEGHGSNRQRSKAKELDAKELSAEGPRLSKEMRETDDARLPKEEAGAERLRMTKVEPGAEESRLPKTEASGEALRAAMEGHGSSWQRAEAKEPGAKEPGVKEPGEDGSRLSKDMRKTDGARLLKEEASAEQLRMSKAETDAEDSRLSTMEASGEAVRAAMEEDKSNNQHAEAKEPGAEKLSAEGSRLSKDMREMDGARLLKEEASAERLRISTAESDADGSCLSKDMQETDDARLPKEETSAEQLRISKAEPCAEGRRMPTAEPGGEALRAAMERYGSNQQRAEAKEPGADGSCLSRDMREMDGSRLLKEESGADGSGFSKKNVRAEELDAVDPRGSVCWYLVEDEGRAALCRELGARAPRRMLPDPSGRRSVALVCALTAAALALILWGVGEPWLMVFGLPLAWGCAWRLLGRFYPKFVKPGRLLKLRLETVPEGARTLVALPVLLSGEGRAREMVARMEALGCLERDPNVDFLLLGDFRDGDAPHEPEDAAILRAAREGVAKLNGAAERERYYYLHRERKLREIDGRWMGENRKRGALMALNRLLLGRDGAASAFEAEGACAERLAGRYRYVITLDADTEYLPGTVQKLVGTMLHPFNRCREEEKDGRSCVAPEMDGVCRSRAARNVDGENRLDFNREFNAENTGSEKPEGAASHSFNRCRKEAKERRSCDVPEMDGVCRSRAARNADGEDRLDFNRKSDAENTRSEQPEGAALHSFDRCREEVKERRSCVAPEMDGVCRSRAARNVDGVNRLDFNRAFNAENTGSEKPEDAALHSFDRCREEAKERRSCDASEMDGVCRGDFAPGAAGGRILESVHAKRNGKAESAALAAEKLASAEADAGKMSGGQFEDAEKLAARKPASAEADVGGMSGGQFEDAGKSAGGKSVRVEVDVGETFGGQFEDAGKSAGGKSVRAEADAGETFGGQFEDAWKLAGGKPVRAEADAGETFGGQFEDAGKLAGGKLAAGKSVRAEANAGKMSGGQFEDAGKLAAGKLAAGKSVGAEADAGMTFSGQFEDAGKLAGGKPASAEVNAGEMPSGQFEDVGKSAAGKLAGGKSKNDIASLENSERGDGEKLRLGNRSGNCSGNHSGNRSGNHSGNRSGNCLGNRSGNRSGNRLRDHLHIGSRSTAPLRRGYAVLQPDMGLTAEASVGAYVELTAGAGGVDGYPTSVSDFYQDMTGRGCFAGKGIYDVRAFVEATEGALDDDGILSHDMIEGILAGAGVVNDVRFYDGCPDNLGAELQRLHRWTRGDWQLLPVLCSKLRLGAADRMKIAGNLLRSLYAPALLGLLTLAIWLDVPGAFALGLALAFLEPVLHLPFSLFGEGRRSWRAALLRLATLPATAFCQLDAILRTLWRLAVTHKHLMDWVTAADASGSNRRTKLPGRIAALLALPGMLRGQWIVPVLGIAMLFWVGAGWADDLSRQKTGERAPLKSGQTALLMELARRTWRFFETYVPQDGPGLPPDNVQLDPDVGPAMRTSPTNIGLYLMSCLAARELGLLADKDMRARMAATVRTLEGLEKWNGHLYNWYDIESLAPLRPRYVSAVDSGNLAGALLLCAHALRESDPALSKRLRALAEGMDLAALYDDERELFRIGMDVEGGRLSESHYDLYASEARILSFAAMMLGQVPVKHWARLNRASVRVGSKSALLSWSGTMFEYLMPELMLRSPANSLAGRSREGVAAWQIRHGRRNRRPWGVSESGYYAFDGQLNYQYRAFGLPELALSGEAEAGVIAPYAAALALCCDPVAATENLRQMCAQGWTDEFGLYEAADYARSSSSGCARSDKGKRTDAAMQSRSSSADHVCSSSTDRARSDKGERTHAAMQSRLASADHARSSSFDCARSDKGERTDAVIQSRPEFTDRAHPDRGERTQAAMQSRLASVDHACSKDGERTHAAIFAGSSSADYTRSDNGERTHAAIQSHSSSADHACSSSADHVRSDKGEQTHAEIQSRPSSANHAHSEDGERTHAAIQSSPEFADHAYSDKGERTQAAVQSRPESADRARLDDSEQTHAAIFARSSSADYTPSDNGERTHTAIQSRPSTDDHVCSDDSEQTHAAIQSSLESADHAHSDDSKRTHTAPLTRSSSADYVRSDKDERPHAAIFAHSSFPNHARPSSSDRALSEGGEPRIVRSHMAHHQGMALCAICNALRGDALAKMFMDIPEARALRLLLQEKPGAMPPRRGRSKPEARAERRPELSYSRGGRRNVSVDTHLLRGANTTALVTARGAAFVWSEGLQLNRFSGDLTNPHEGMFVHLEDAETGACMVFGGSGRASFDAGLARFREEFEGLEAELQICVSPEDGALYQIVEIENPGDEARTLTAIGCLAAALAPERDMRAHPAFQNLFVEGGQLTPYALLLRRRPRTPGQALPGLIYAVSGGTNPRGETRLDALLGRKGSLGAPDGLNREFTEGEEREFAGEADREFADGADRELRDGAERDFLGDLNREFLNGQDQEFPGGADREFSYRPKQAFADGGDREFSDRLEQEFTDGADWKFPNGTDRTFSCRVGQEFTDGSDRKSFSGTDREFRNEADRDFLGDLDRESLNGEDQEFSYRQEQAFTDGAGREFPGEPDQEFHDGPDQEFSNGENREFLDGKDRNLLGAMEREPLNEEGQEFSYKPERAFTDKANRAFSDGMDREFTDEAYLEFPNGTDRTFSDRVGQEFTDRADRESLSRTDREFRNGADRDFLGDLDRAFTDGTDRKSFSGTDREFHNGADRDFLGDLDRAFTDRANRESLSGANRDFLGEGSALLNPCAALRVRVEIAPKSKARLHFALLLVPAEEAARAMSNAGARTRRLLAEQSQTKQSAHPTPTGIRENIDKQNRRQTAEQETNLDDRLLIDETRPGDRLLIDETRPDDRLHIDETRLDDRLLFDETRSTYAASDEKAGEPSPSRKHAAATSHDTPTPATIHPRSSKARATDAASSAGAACVARIAPKEDGNKHPSPQSNRAARRIGEDFSTPDDRLHSSENRLVGEIRDAGEACATGSTSEGDGNEDPSPQSDRAAKSMGETSSTPEDHPHSNEIRVASAACAARIASEGNGNKHPSPQINRAARRMCEDFSTPDDRPHSNEDRAVDEVRAVEAVRTASENRVTGAACAAQIAPEGDGNKHPSPQSNRAARMLSEDTSTPDDRLHSSENCLVGEIRATGAAYVTGSASEGNGKGQPTPQSDLAARREGEDSSTPDDRPHFSENRAARMLREDSPTPDDRPYTSENRAARAARATGAAYAAGAVGGAEAGRVADAACTARIPPEENGDARISLLRGRVARALSEDAADRALRLAVAQSRTVLSHAGLDGARFALYQRAAALLFDAKLRPGLHMGAEAWEPVDRRALWSAGVSGDLPILLVELDERGDLSRVREGVRLHAFYRSMGVATDFVLLDGRDGDYRRNAGGELGGLIAASHLSGLLDMPGGAHIRETGGLERVALDALRRAAALRLRPESSPLAQLRGALDGLKLRGGEEYRPMRAVELPVPDDLRDFNGYGGFRLAEPGEAPRNETSRRSGGEEARRAESENSRRARDKEARRAGDEEARRSGGEEAKREGSEDSRSFGDEEARRTGDKKVKHAGSTDSRRFGGEEAKRAGNEEARCTGDKETKHEGRDDSRRFGDEEARRAGDKEARCTGGEKAKHEGSEDSRRAGSDGFRGNAGNGLDAANSDVETCADHRATLADERPYSGISVRESAREDSLPDSAAVRMELGSFDAGATGEELGSFGGNASRFDNCGGNASRKRPGCFEANASQKSFNSFDAGVPGEERCGFDVNAPQGNPCDVRDDEADGSEASSACVERCGFDVEAPREELGGSNVNSSWESLCNARDDVASDGSGASFARVERCGFGANAPQESLCDARDNVARDGSGASSSRMERCGFGEGAPRESLCDARDDVAHGGSGDSFARVERCGFGANAPRENLNSFDANAPQESPCDARDDIARDDSGDSSSRMERCGFGANAPRENLNSFDANAPQESPCDARDDVARNGSGASFARVERCGLGEGVLQESLCDVRDDVVCNGSGASSSRMERCGFGANAPQESLCNARDDIARDGSGDSYSRVERCGFGEGAPQESLCDARDDVARDGSGASSSRMERCVSDMNAPQESLCDARDDAVRDGSEAPSAHAERCGFGANAPREALNCFGANAPRKNLNSSDSNAPRERLNCSNANAPREALNCFGATAPRENLNRSDSNAPRESLNSSDATAPRESLNCSNANAPRERLNCSNANVPRENHNCFDANVPQERLNCFDADAPREALGGFAGCGAEGAYHAAEGAYHILLRGGGLPPAPWCNVIASERAGAVISERGGGFAWVGNSRGDRLTPFANDALREGWGWMFYLVDAREREYLRLLPGDCPMTDFDVRFAPGRCAWAGRTEGLAFELRAHAVDDGILFEVELSNEARAARELTLLGFADWRMGTDAADDALLRCWSRFGACFASGAARGVGCFACDDPAAAPGCDRRTLLSGGDVMRPRGFDMLDAVGGGWTLRAPVKLRPGEAKRWRFLLGCAGGVPEAYALARDFRAGVQLPGATDWPRLLDALRVETPDPALNFLANGFLQAQALDSRVRGRTGMYQPGGAYGFRDQLQDVIALAHWQPQRARRHLLYCAARQFAEGDVLHWWHEPATGVRTKVSDDLLFLPWAAAKYVRLTGDASVLADSAPYLEDVAIPEGAEDVYAEMRPAPLCEPLHRHCMRALRHAAKFGPHGLCRMGGGDWNDGMNRVGGESVWLSEFLAAVAADYAEVAPDEADRAWLTALSERLRAAIEEHAWDGEWYLRAFAEDGSRLGGRACEACRIDLISQAWAVLAGLDEARCRSAMDAAWERLADEKQGIVKLLDPPFDSARGGFDPGYIAAYPPGIRENGAQYTHAACWYLCAAIRQGDAERAHRLLRMLLPLNHARDARAAEVYRVEPYVMAADVYSNPEFAGRGGWTWYTGSAGWMLQAILMLLGYERRGSRVRLRALLGDWPEASVTLRWGASRYRLISRRGAEQITLDGKAIEGEFVEMRDDGKNHIAIFPCRH